MLTKRARAGDLLCGTSNHELVLSNFFRSFSSLQIFSFLLLSPPFWVHERRQPARQTLHSSVGDFSSRFSATERARARMRDFPLNFRRAWITYRAQFRLRLFGGNVTSVHCSRMILHLANKPPRTTLHGHGQSNRTRNQMPLFIETKLRERECKSSTKKTGWISKINSHEYLTRLRSYILDLLLYRQLVRQLLANTWFSYGRWLPPNLISFGSSSKRCSLPTWNRSNHTAPASTVCWNFLHHDSHNRDPGLNLILCNRCNSTASSTPETPANLGHDFFRVSNSTQSNSTNC